MIVIIFDKKSISIHDNHLFNRILFSIINTSMNNHDKIAKLKKFADWAGEKIGLDVMPKIEYSNDNSLVQDRRTFGSNMMGETIWVHVGERNTADIMRTLCHELIHSRQFELGTAHDNMDKEQEQFIEDQANALAGRYMRIYGKLDSSIYESKEPKTGHVKTEYDFNQAVKTMISIVNRIPTDRTKPVDDYEEHAKELLSKIDRRHRRGIVRLINRGVKNPNYQSAILGAVTSIAAGTLFTLLQPLDPTTRRVVLTGLINSIATILGLKLAGSTWKNAIKQAVITSASAMGVISLFEQEADFSTDLDLEADFTSRL